MRENSSSGTRDTLNGTAPSGENIRPITDASYDTKPSPRGENIRALMNASYDVGLPLRGDNI